MASNSDNAVAPNATVRAPQAPLPRPACPEQAADCPGADPSVTLDATRRVTHFLKVPAEQAEAYLPEGWPAWCHTALLSPPLSRCVTEPLEIADLWWLVLEFTGGRTGGHDVGPGHLGFVLVETRAQGEMERPGDNENHEFVPVDTFTDEPVLHEWLHQWNLTSAAGPQAEITVSVTGSEADAWAGGASGASGDIQLDGDGVFRTIRPHEVHRDDDYRMFLFDPSAGKGPESFVSFRTSYGPAEGGISHGGAAQGRVPGFSGDAWAADATWIVMEHEVELLHEKIGG